MARKRDRSAVNVVMVVARNIRRLREARGESKLGFAQRTGLNRNSLNGWKKGTRTSTFAFLRFFHTTRVLVSLIVQHL